MTNPTEAAKQRACDLANEWVNEDYEVPLYVSQFNEGDCQPTLLAFAEHIQAVSDAVKALNETHPTCCAQTWSDMLSVHILPDPEPDPLAMALRALATWPARPSDEDAAVIVRNHLAKSGHTITRTAPEGSE